MLKRTGYYVKNLYALYGEGNGAPSRRQAAARRRVWTRSPSSSTELKFIGDFVRILESRPWPGLYKTNILHRGGTALR